MNKIILSRSLVTLIVLTVFLPLRIVQDIKANPSFITRAPINHAYILNNGEIDPPTLPIKQIGNIYTLTDNILNYTIIILKDNIILDGNGYALTSILSGYDSGSSSIQITNRTNIIIRNIKFDRCYGNISVRNSSIITIFQNTMINGNFGIHMYQSTSCNIIGNKITDNSGPGFHVMESSFINITYNTILRNYGHGGWIAISNSTINRNYINNNHAPNVGIGLYLYGSNINNHIFENNFIDNEIGLFYQGARGISANNTVYNNYWSNYKDEIVNVAADEVSGVDQSPLSRPYPISFNPNLYPWFSLAQFPDPTPTPSPFSASNHLALPSTLELVAIVMIIVFVLGLAVNLVKKRRT
jgi:parallel beta-helix repeat protein